MTEYIISQNANDSVYTPRGAALDFMYDHSPELILSGPAETGKTLAACWKAHTIACKYPKSQGALIRKTGVSIAGTVFLTMKRVIAGAPVEVYGGDNKPEKLIYSNGSVIWIGGMDKPDKVLSGERDFIQVCQAEELAVEDWEVMTTRTTGRGAVYPYPQIFGDCNPSGSKHWILGREKAGSIKILRSLHTDNPTLYTGNGQITEQGIRTMSRLSALTGVRRKRLLEGIWATSEGAVYDTFDNGIHVKPRDYKEFSWFGLAVDEGYTNPAVCLLIGIDADGRLHVFKEFHKRQVLQDDFCNLIQSWYIENNTRLIAVDAAAAGLIADLRNRGVPARPSKGRVLDRIQKVQDLLAIQSDGKPRLTFDPSCTETINEFESYLWKPEKDMPIKENDHAPDALGYFVDIVIVKAGKAKSQEIDFYAPPKPKTIKQPTRSEEEIKRMLQEYEQ